MTGTRTTGTRATGTRTIAGTTTDTAADPAAGSAVVSARRPKNDATGGPIDDSSGGPAAMLAAAAVAVAEGFLAALGRDPADLSVEEVRAQMHVVRSVQAVAAARLLALDERMRTIAITSASPFPVDPRRELCRHGGLRRREARAMESQAAAADAAPSMAHLLAAGATTAGHLDALGQALRIAGDGRDALLGRVDEITHRAATSSVDDFDAYVRRLARDAQPDEGVSRFEQQRRRSFCRIWTESDGMTRLSAAFDPERGAAIAGRLDRHVEALFHGGDTGHRDADGFAVAPDVDPNDHRRAIALHALCTRTTTTNCATDGATDCTDGGVVDPRPVRAEVIVHVDLDTLRSGLHRHGVCRTSHGADLSPDTARRLACEADIIPAVLDGRSVPLDVGRAKRLATVHQRRALEAVHDSCAVPECDVGFTRCVIHHLRPWEHGGASDLANMVPLCNAHHHAVHEGGWTITVDPTTRHVQVTPGSRRGRPTGAHESSASRPALRSA